MQRAFNRIWRGRDAVHGHLMHPRHRTRRRICHRSGHDEPFSQILAPSAGKRHRDKRPLAQSLCRDIAMHTHDLPQHKSSLSIWHQEWSANHARCPGSPAVYSEIQQHGKQKVGCRGTTHDTLSPWSPASCTFPRILKNAFTSHLTLRNMDLSSEHGSQTQSRSLCCPA